MYKKENSGKILVEGNERSEHRLCGSGRTPQSIYDMYYGRSDKSPEIIESMMNQLVQYYHYFYHEAAKQIKGNQGEDMVRKYFSLFADKYPSRMNVILPIRDEFARTSELDSVIVTPKGILVCEIKNWGSEKEDIHIAGDDTWYICKNHKREKKKNPFEQNIRHAIALEKYLKARGITCRIIPVVVIADSKTTVVNESGKTVLKSSAVYEYIESRPFPETIDVSMQKKILELLDHTDREENAFPCGDLISAAEAYEDAIYHVFRLRDQEYELENELFSRCSQIISACEFRVKKWMILLYAAAGIGCIAGVIVFMPVIKFGIGVLLLGIACGGFACGS